MVDEVDLLNAKPSFAHDCFPDGRENTVSTSDLAPCLKTNAIEPSSELTNDLPAAGTAAEVENAQKPLKQTDKHDLASSVRLNSSINSYKLTQQILATRVYVDYDSSANREKNMGIQYLID